MLDKLLNLHDPVMGALIIAARVGNFDEDCAGMKQRYALLKLKQLLLLGSWEPENYQVLFCVGVLRWGILVCRA